LALGEDPSGHHYDEHEHENNDQIFGYPDGAGYDEGPYEEYPEELATVRVVHEAKSPNAGKRIREDEPEVLDVQDIKRSRSS